MTYILYTYILDMVAIVNNNFELAEDLCDLHTSTCILAMIAILNYNYVLAEDVRDLHTADLHTGQCSDRELQFGIAGRHCSRAPDCSPCVAGLLILASHSRRQEGRRSISPVSVADGRFPEDRNYRFIEYMFVVDNLTTGERGTLHRALR